MLADDVGTKACQQSTNPDDSCRLPVLGRAGPHRAGPGWAEGWVDSWIAGWAADWVLGWRGTEL